MATSSNAVATFSAGPRQFIRKVGLMVSTAPAVDPLRPDITIAPINPEPLPVDLTGFGTDKPGAPIDLSNLRVRFEVHSADSESPNTAFIRIYNPNPETVSIIQSEYQTVSLQAGYQRGNFSIIFQGTIKQFRFGKESNVDTYLDIMAAEADEAYNFGVVNLTLAAGSTALQRVQAIADEIKMPLHPSVAEIVAASGGILPSARTMFGMARSHLRTIADSIGARWSIQDGKIVFIPLAGYLPGTAVVVNSTSGMVGIPEATQNGVTVQMLLNPLLRIGTRLQINNADITQTQVNAQGFPTFKSVDAYFARINTDGFYRVMSIDHYGDTRGQEWYSNVICLSLDPSTGDQGKPSVQPYG